MLLTSIAQAQTLAQVDKGNRELIIGLIGALVGAGIAVGYDLFKTWRLERKRDRLILNLIREELLSATTTLLAVRDVALAEKLDHERSTFPMPIPESDLWEVMRVGIPKAVREDSELQLHLRNVHHGVRQVANVRRSREELRLKGNWAGWMAKEIRDLDSMIVHEIEVISQSSRPALEAIERHIERLPA